MADLDQWDDEISADVLPVVGAILDVANRDGTSSRMRVFTVRRDETGRIVEYTRTAADAAMLDMPFAAGWSARRPTPTQDTSSAMRL